MPDSATTNPTRIPNERATQRVVVQRRNRVIRNITVFAITTLCLALIVSANRDRQAIEDCRKQIDHAAADLTLDLIADRPLPLVLPLNPKLRLDRTHYTYAPASHAVAGQDQPLAIVYCSSPHALVIRRSGRHVAIRNGDRIEVRWMSEDDIRNNSDTLGIRLLTPP